MGFDIQAKQMGIKGEKLAEKYLKNLHYKIIAKNYQNRLGEIDIVAIETKKSRKLQDDYSIMPKTIQNEDVLIFVEVKNRSSLSFGAPSEFVDKKKQNNYYKVFQYFISEKKLEGMQIRFDIIEVYSGKINHIKNAF